METQTGRPAPATYGEFVTLPNVDGIVWKITDARDYEKSAEGTGTRARLVPFHPGIDGGEPTAYGWDEPVKIGRAERVGVEIDLSIRDGALSAYATRRSYEASLTEAQSALLKAAALDPFAVNLYLPPLSDEEIRARVARLAKGAGEDGAREARKRLPRMYNLYNGNAERIREAFESDTDGATLAEMLETATAAFRAEFARELRTLGAVSA